ncbi:MAG: AAA family ATPase [Stenomitos rutilans HA7619-LM2]|jgi:hypothetical protein|nr:AAA family ATPase [Stenomitos rutilans HA7619-LM2]
MTTDLRRNALNELLQEIYDATVTGTPELELPQIARWSGVPLETLEDIGKRLVEKKLNHDIDADQFNEMLSRYRKIDQIEDAGLRAWKLQGLARRYKRPVQHLTEAYSKALVNQCAVKPLTPKEFRALHEAEVDWLVKGWIPTGTMLLLHADGGVGKTLFSYELMECVLTGKPWNGYPVKQGKVLLVQTDEPTLVTHERIDIRGIDDEAPLSLLTDWQIEAMARLETFVKETRPELLIVDSLTSINRSCVFSENDTEYARPLLELARLGNTYGCTVIIIHHSNAEGNSRGTRAIYNSVSEVWGLSKGEQLNDRLLRVQKTRLGRPPGRYRFRFDDEDFTFAYQGEDYGPDHADQSDTEATNEKRIQLWLNEGDRPGTPFTAQEVSEFLGLAYDTTRRSLYELWAKGLVKRSRLQGQKQYTYFTSGLLRDVTTDQLIAPSKPSDQLCKPDAITVSPPTDQLITQNTVFETEKNLKTKRSVDQYEAFVTFEAVTTPQIGDIIVAKAHARWIRSGSDKLPWREVRPSDKQAAEIPIDLLTATLFEELIQPSKVLELTRDSQKVKVRQQTTGRTSVFPISDVCVLKKVGNG